MGIGPPSIFNKLLLALPSADLRGILPLMESVALRQAQVLTQADWPIQRVYFIESGVACLFSRGKEPIEIEMVGRWGMIGLPVLLGVNTAPFRSVVQLPGNAMSLSASDFRSAVAKYPTFRELLLKYVQLRLTIEAQAIYCNAKHSLEQRLARWLLKAHDYVGGNRISASHELLSRMLAVRRAGITLHLGSLEQQKIIQNSRCSIEITDREELVKKACHCYEFVQAEYRRLIPIAHRDYLKSGGERLARANLNHSAQLENLS
jgi:CRP-like cAMP-binding protein